MPSHDSDRSYLSQGSDREIAPNDGFETANVTPAEWVDIAHVLADLEPMVSSELNATEQEAEGETDIPPVPREKRWVEFPNGWRMPLVEYEALKARKRRNQADCRARQRAAAEAARPQVVRLTTAEMAAEAKRFVAWAKLNGPRQRQFRPQARRYVHARFVLLELRRETGATPGPADFGRRLAARFPDFGQIKPAGAAQVLRQIQALEQPGGPWER